MLEATAIREYTDRNGEVRKAYTKLGVALPHKSGNGFTLLLNAMPAPTDGQYIIQLFEQREKNEPPERQAGPPLDDSIPF